MSEERRKHPRTALRLQGSLYALGNKYPCELVDFSLGGLRLKIQDDVFSQDEVITLSLFMDNNLYKLDIQLHFVSDEFLGVSFYNKESPIISRLDLIAKQQSLSKTAQTDEDGATKKSATELEKQNRIFDALKDIGKTSTVRWVTSFLELLANRLEEKSAQSTGQAAETLAGYAGTVSEYTPYIIRDFRSVAMVPVDTFMVQHWQNDFELPGEGSNQLSQPALENWLLTRMMIGDCEMANSAALADLQSRLKTLTGRDMELLDNPFGPFVIAYAFKSSLDKNEVEDRLQKILLEQFSPYLQKQLPAFYENLNKVLNDENILPELDATQAAVSPSGTSPGEATLPTADIPREAPNAWSLYTLLKQLRDLARSQRQDPLVEDEPLMIGSKQLEDEELAAFVRDLPRDRDRPGNLSAVLKESLEPGDIALTEDQLFSVLLTGEFFNQLAEDPFIDPEIAAQLQILEFPVLAMILEGNDFLDQSGHPARQFINTIATLGVRETQRFPQVDKQIQQAIEQLASLPCPSPGDFQQATELLQKTRDTQEIRKSRNIGKLLESLEGRHKLEETRKQVEQLLEDRFGGKCVPKAAITLANTGWKDLMVNTLVRKGPHSKEWQTLVSVLDDVISLADPLSPRQVNLKNVLTVIKLGLEQINTGKVDEELVGQLRQLFESKQGNDQPETVTPQAGSFSSITDYTSEDIPEEIRHWIERLEAMNTGQCIRVDGDETGFIHLAWISDSKNRFVFVNNLGIKSADLDIMGLATYLESGKYELEEQFNVPATDYCLSNLKQSINQMLARK